ncbi:AI-2E family transporter [Demequina sp. SYSU T00192]|uniref:AI-2E family transporter n=1 Tax=Demequina litoralis TaxID=3051660 RepID=A0ABT8G8T9_9MICO|nr:AI-2E family transporter [Demequina sp. SYSU T00192]MDN4475558.1 AI-2E family transporter [Demequina sp. SYSU T00192]
MTADSPAPDTEELPEEVARAAAEQAAMRAEEPAPLWIDSVVRRALWRTVGVVLTVMLGLWIAFQMRHLLGILVLSLFIALAMLPGVTGLHRRYGMRRGAAVGLMYLAAVLLVVFMVAVLIPAIARFADAVHDNLPGWTSALSEWSRDVLGLPIDTTATDDALTSFSDVVATWADEVLGIVTSGIGLIFDLFTVATFAFYIAAQWPQIMRALMSRMPPARQRTFAWIADTSIEQTGGYFYSRLLLMGVCGGLGFVVMLLVGLPLVYAIPLALFMGFVSEFIPFIGTYIGAALPIIIVLAVQGLVPALILLAWVLVYQQAENYWLSPRFSSQTMELNGAVAFGGALAGGAIAGPLGAFMALPVAALITAIVKNSGRTYDVIPIDEASPAAEPARASSSAKDAADD